jgi:hypothetical protein
MNTPRIKRQYVWEKPGGRCWYCGVRLYYREEAEPRSKNRSSLLPTISILERRAAGVAQTKCLRASTVIRARAHEASNNFGNGYRS